MEEHRYIEHVVHMMPDTFSQLESLLVANDDFHVILWLTNNMLITKDKLLAKAPCKGMEHFPLISYIIDVTGAHDVEAIVEL